MLYVKYGNSSKLGPKVMKPALESSFYLKIKNKRNHLIGVVCCHCFSVATYGWYNIWMMSSKLPPSNNSRRCFKKSCDHHFYDHLVLFLVFTCPALCLSQNRTWILENAREHIQPFIRGTLLVKKFLTWRLLRGATLNFK